MADIPHRQVVRKFHRRQHQKDKNVPARQVCHEEYRPGTLQPLGLLRNRVYIAGESTYHLEVLGGLNVQLGEVPVGAGEQAETRHDSRKEEDIGNVCA